ncbi:cytochrome b-c1 complex subunit 6-like protein [Dinothrombium tinctorium]|uniref:Cytochrome b-c1 complex subunit 6 n=1 Tax=Dinothrombium tinctorium TaxID=1965070 RepID=A0A443RNY3_9ACAR|nr:cytochrome b-c1 complex subunit 6-like protein [Dinothrombium tinctorium]
MKQANSAKQESSDSNEDVKEANKSVQSEELIDPQSVIREQCKASLCNKYFKKLEFCNQRVNSGKAKANETCWEEVVDFVHCTDHCISRTLFSKLK